MERIENHPILGTIEERKEVEIIFNGEKLTAYKGETIAAALTANGYRVFRYTSNFKNPRGYFCGIGQCTDCTMEVNNRSNVRTCITEVEDGMIVNTQYGTGKNDNNCAE